MKLCEVAKFTPGAFLNRIESVVDDETMYVKPLSLKEFNKTLGLSYRMANEKNVPIAVSKSKLLEKQLTNSASLVIHTHSRKMALLPERYNGMLLTNTFIKVELPAEIDLAYFEWYFNEHPSIIKQLSVLSQGTLAPILKLTDLKELEVEFPPLEKQKVIGRIAQLQRKKAILVAERNELQQYYTNQLLIQSTN